MPWLQSWSQLSAIISVLPPVTDHIPVFSLDLIHVSVTRSLPLLFTKSQTSLLPQTQSQTLTPSLHLSVCVPQSQFQPVTHVTFHPLTELQFQPLMQLQCLSVCTQFCLCLDPVSAPDLALYISSKDSIPSPIEKTVLYVFPRLQHQHLYYPVICVSPAVSSHEP